MKKTIAYFLLPFITQSLHAMEYHNGKKDSFNHYLPHIQQRQESHSSVHGESIYPQSLAVTLAKKEYRKSKRGKKNPAIPLFPKGPTKKRRSDTNSKENAIAQTDTQTANLQYPYMSNVTEFSIFLRATENHHNDEDRNQESCASNEFSTQIDDLFYQENWSLPFIAPLQYNAQLSPYVIDNSETETYPGQLEQYQQNYDQQLQDRPNREQFDHQQIYSCPQEGCNNHFETPNLLRDHLNNKHKEIATGTEFLCPYCNINNSNCLKGYIAHIEECCFLFCFECNTLCKIRKKLRDHLRFHIYRCCEKDCDYSSDRPKHLKKHLENKHSLDPDTMNFICPHCKLDFQSNYYIKNCDYKDNYYSEHLKKCYKPKVYRFSNRKKKTQLLLD